MPWLHRGFDLNAQVQLDGVELDGVAVYADEIKAGQEASMRGHHTSNSTLRLFSFGKRILTDREDIAPSGGLSQDDLNSIRVTFEWGHAGEEARTTDFVIPEENKPMHEKAAKKGHSGSAGLGGTANLTSESLTCDFKPSDEIKPIVFVFRYGPEDWLQAREIIPPENPPSLKREYSNTPDIIDVDDLEVEDDQDIMIVKHLVPAPVVSNVKRRKIKDEDDVKLKLES
ncbi:hypothetical protein FRC09_008473 [Ceratobasidium sp. 395]|nr:hypothetical protein FRC09_008473 [Ceratobasidium sp. 395]